MCSSDLEAAVGEEFGKPRLFGEGWTGDFWCHPSILSRCQSVPKEVNWQLRRTTQEFPFYVA